MKETKNLNYPMLERLSFIHREILKESFPNTRELAEKLETSISTISRDIEFLRVRLNAPIEYNYTEKGYYYFENYNPNFSNHLSDKDLQVLMSTKVLLAHFKHTPIYNEATALIDLLTAQVLNNKNTELLNRIAVAPRVETKINEDHWIKIQDALRGNFILVFDYTNSSGKKSTKRRMCPYQLVFDEGSCYLFGYDKEKKEERIFSLPRMNNLIVSDVVFKLPEDFEFLNRTNDGKFGAFVGTGLEHYKIEFYNDSQIAIKERKWANNQKIIEVEGKTILSFDSNQHASILYLVLSHGGNAIPLSPDRLVKAWKENVKKMAKNISYLPKHSS